jgi:DNA-directed RNA polymerase sigma subunit (sigma70/sigma32)
MPTLQKKEEEYEQHEEVTAPFNLRKFADFNHANEEWHSHDYDINDFLKPLEEILNIFTLREELVLCFIYGISTCRMKNFLSELPEEPVLTYNSDDDATLGSVAKVFGVSGARIRQILVKSLKKLMHPSRLCKLTSNPYRRKKILKI